MAVKRAVFTVNTFFVHTDLDLPIKVFTVFIVIFTLYIQEEERRYECS